MQMKAVKQGLKIKEVPVDYKNHIGKLKVSGTISRVIKADIKIIYSVFKYAWEAHWLDFFIVKLFQEALTM